MYWVDNGTGVTIPPTIPPVQSSVRQYFTEGGQSLQPTIPGGEWFNMVTDELLAVLAEAGVSASKVDHAQLLLSIQKLIERKTKYGCPLIGKLIEWPHQLMPHEIFTDIGMTFIPYIGQAFGKDRFPLLAKLHPSGVLPADMRGEFPRGWDNERGVDAGRVLMSQQDSSNKSHAHPDLYACGGSPGGTPVTNSGFAKEFYPINTPELRTYPWTGGSAGLTSAPSGENEARPRSIAWNMIVRAA
ncbi:hypothetical protein C7R88_01950 [Plesiomonas shigelloides]|uniref:hypothetical protein n=1 Tax=Plesiomonas shigelloides TaxID=703 RepID=UPI000D126891|nr:hypothetical protein [Plesiomonas shigelloides]AVQ86178.1 hypothetical protein C7R88_01950 [Plesiomonas shigelloides]